MEEEIKRILQKIEINLTISVLKFILKKDSEKNTIRWH